MPAGGRRRRARGMLLSSVLETTAECCDEDSCCALFADGDGDGDGDDMDGGCPTRPSTSFRRDVSFLTYRGALQAQRKHAEWLRLLLEPPSSSRGGKAEPRNEDAPDPPHEQVVYVAYLSSNNVDLLLSVLACSGLSLSGSSKARGGNDYYRLATTRVVPVLLNARWTTPEMIQALRPQSANLAALVYDASPSSRFEAQARQVAAALGEAGCAPLPLFSREHFQPRTKAVPSSFPQPCPPPFPTEAAVRGKIELLASEQGNVRPVDRDALVLFTSGTSSSRGSRGVRLSHRALLVQALAKLLPPVHYTDRTVLLATTVPFYHVGGLSSALAVWMAGGCLALPASSGNASTSIQGPAPSPSFDPSQVFRSLRTAGVNTLVVVPAMLHALMMMTSHQEDELPERREAAAKTYPHVICVLVGGQSASHAVLQFCRATFPNAAIVQTYACTEAASSLTFRDVGGDASGDPLVDRKGSSQRSQFVGDCVGTPPQHVELAILPVPESSPSVVTGCEPGHREEFTAGGVGVIATRGPHVMNGYWDSSGNRSNKPHFVDWHVTGDLGRIDDLGQLWFCGRVADSIRTGGETVLAGEVERALQEHPRVQDVAVFGLPDDKFGHAVACAIVLREGDGNGNGNGTDAGMSVRRLREWCAQMGLAGYKRPRKVFVVHELPKNSSGKTLKYLLVERFSQSEGSVPKSKL